MSIGLRISRGLVLDIGSSHTVVASKRKSHLLRVPSRIALSGDYVKKPLQGAQGKVNSKNHNKKNQEKFLVSPVERGKVVDIYAMEQLLKGLLKKSGWQWNLPTFRKTVGLLAPPFLDETEKSALRALMVDVGFNRVNLIERPFATAKGCGMDINQPRGQMVIDIGGGKMNSSLLSLGGLVTWNEEQFGGNDLDRAIFSFVTKRFDVDISLRTAEEIKLAIGSVYPKEKPEKMTFTALERQTEVPKKITLDDNDIRDVLGDACEPLIKGIQESFAAVPPELAGDIAKNGITLLGGGSLLPGLPEFLKERTELGFHISEDPINANIRGARELMWNIGKGH